MRPPPPAPPKGVEVEELHVGEGTQASPGDRVAVRYSGWLNRGDAFATGETIDFDIGRREVFAGLERGVLGMRPGGKRRLRIPPHLAYGAAGVPGRIPAHAVLTLEVELLTINGYPKR